MLKPPKGRPSYPENATCIGFSFTLTQRVKKKRLYWKSNKDMKTPASLNEIMALLPSLWRETPPLPIIIIYLSLWKGSSYSQRTYASYFPRSGAQPSPLSFSSRLTWSWWKAALSDVSIGCPREKVEPMRNCTPDHDKVDRLSRDISLFRLHCSLLAQITA